MIQDRDDHISLKGGGVVVLGRLVNSLLLLRVDVQIHLLLAKLRVVILCVHRLYEHHRFTDVQYNLLLAYLRVVIL